MKSIWNVGRVTAALATILLLSGCVSGPNMPWLPAGAITTDMIVPGQVVPSGTGGPTGPGLRQGTASCKAVLFIAGWGDCSIQAAAAAGGITHIRTIDWRYENYLAPIFYRYTLIVTGD
ncbi:TRL domain-containing protein [Methylocaldum szegediense]|uniref:TRL (tRNA-associated locus)-like protein n=1 Tax=Methylocaldum szegediense TaxID=73780 RepID=A0ABN8X0B4_9GAMM|nr:TRL domain-containing protein [Methylocaldum szegediense]CAI8731318.1 TRL (tRNA-associated locus)-like protein [Methylocaldum szegediense]